MPIEHANSNTFTLNARPRIPSATPIVKGFTAKSFTFAVVLALYPTLVTLHIGIKI